MNSARSVLSELRRQADPKRVQGMAKFAAGGKNTIGVSMPTIRGLARRLHRDHAIAQELWRSGIHEARIMASLIAEPAQVTPDGMEAWVKDFDAWDVCDQVCMNLFCRTPFGFEKAVAWSTREREFEKRAGFALMACLAVHAKTEPDERFLPFLGMIERESTDDRNFVKKAVNWALRQIGKRSRRLNREAIKAAKAIATLDSASARWIAADALRELKNSAVKERFKKK